MKPQLRECILLVCSFFYLLAVLEVNVGEYVQTFGDEYDTYIQSKEATERSTVDVTKLPGHPLQVIHTLLLLIYPNAACLPQPAVSPISFASPTRLHLRLSVFLI